MVFGSSSFSFICAVSLYPNSVIYGSFAVLGVRMLAECCVYDKSVCYLVKMFYLFSPQMLTLTWPSLMRNCFNFLPGRGCSSFYPPPPLWDPPPPPPLLERRDCSMVFWHPVSLEFWSRTRQYTYNLSQTLSYPGAFFLFFVFLARIFVVVF